MSSPNIKHKKPNTKKILFRADAHPSIGSGDLMSLIHLSRYFEKNGWSAHFLIKDFPSARKMVSDYDVQNVEVLDCTASIAEEVSVINRAINERHIDLVFFEITENKLSQYQGISPHVAKACVSFDGSLLPDMNVVVDWDVAAGQFFNPELYPKTTFLLGPEFVILPISFDSDRIAARTYQASPRKLMICMGGADELNYTEAIVDLLIKNNVRLETAIVVGYGYPHRERLEKKVMEAKSHYKIRQNITDMFEAYMNCDVAIGAGGLTASELVATRTPSILIATYEHQIARCEYFHEKKWAKFIGYRSFNENDLIHSIYNPPSTSSEPIFNTIAIVHTCNAIAN